jgi:hypothetical protein
MKSGQIGNGSVSPFTNTSTEKITRSNREEDNFPPHLNSWPP